MKTDEFNTVINDPSTYKEIAFILSTGQPVLIAWTDQAGTQLDLLFNYKAKSFGPIQRGILSSDLFVSVMGLSSFGFDVREKKTDGGYYSGKLRMSGTETCEKLAELINGIKKFL
jgi:hypothetical protein